MFFNRNDEFFVFALRPIRPESGTHAIGFIVADLPYIPWKHQSGPGFPDLEMVSITLKLLAGLWEFRNDSRSYFHILGAIPLLRHSGGRVLETVDWIQDRLRGTSLPVEIEDDFKSLRGLAFDVARAKDIVESLRRSGGKVQPLPLLDALANFAGRMKSRHPQWLAGVEFSCPIDLKARIHQDALDEILTCLVDNAAVHGSTNGATVRVVLAVEEHTVPVCGGKGEQRLLLTVANDGATISPELTPFLFANRVSTHHNGFGSGLSSARQLAKAFGGDVVLLCANPVEFGVVLEVSNC